jgi:aminomethyltransferase
LADSGAQRTALFERHAALGARSTTFGGWEMPLRYGSIVEEHHAVRRAAGLFDLSHMGELRVRGRHAAEALGGALASDPRRLSPGRAHYSLLCTPDGGIIDDLIVYRLAADELLVVPNAGNRERVAVELAARLDGRADLADETLATSLVAIQGPAAAGILAPLCSVELDRLRPYGCARGSVGGVDALVARTGYTGEDGFECFVAWDDGPRLWDELLAAGAPAGLRPAGLGARDTLRLEAGMPLYGNELDLETDPFEAGLGRFVHLEREPGVDGPVPGFAGREALVARASGPRRRQLGGLQLAEGRGIARHGHAVRRPGEPEDIGRVTSGSQSPTLGVPIAMAWLPPSEATAGTMLEVAIRETLVPAVVVPLPFYRRPR